MNDSSSDEEVKRVDGRQGASNFAQSVTNKKDNRSSSNFMDVLGMGMLNS